jgi:hypothetical protein
MCHVLWAVEINQADLFYLKVLIDQELVERINKEPVVNFLKRLGNRSYS